MNELRNQSFIGFYCPPAPRYSKNIRSYSPILHEQQTSLGGSTTPAATDNVSSQPEERVEEASKGKQRYSLVAEKYSIDVVESR